MTRTKLAFVGFVAADNSMSHQVLDDAKVSASLLQISLFLRTKQYPVQLRTTKYYSSTTPYYKVLVQYYFVLQSTTPVLFCTTKYYPSTTLYYKVLFQKNTTPVLQSTTPESITPVLQSG